MSVPQDLGLPIRIPLRLLSETKGAEFWGEDLPGEIVRMLRVQPRYEGASPHHGSPGSSFCLSWSWSSGLCGLLHQGLQGGEPGTGGGAKGSNDRLLWPGQVRAHWSEYPRDYSPAPLWQVKTEGSSLSVDQRKIWAAHTQTRMAVSAPPTPVPDPLLSVPASIYLCETCLKGVPGERGTMRGKQEPRNL